MRGSRARAGQQRLRARQDEREGFDLVGIERPTHVEAAELLVVRAVTVKRRLSRDVWLLTDQLAELRPGGKPPDAI